MQRPAGLRDEQPRLPGPSGLAAAVRRTGGGAHWAAVLGIRATPLRRWTDELVEAELRRVCAGRGR